MRRTPIRLALVLAMVALAAAGCGQDAQSAHDHGAVTVVASTDVWGSVASAVAGQHASVKSIETGVDRRPALVRSNARPMWRRSPMRRWWSTTAAATTTGWTTCWQAIPKSTPSMPTLCAAPISAPTNTSSTTCTSPRPSQRTSPSGSPRSIRHTPTITVPTQPNSADRPTPSPSPSGRSAKAHPSRVRRCDRTGRVLPAAQRRNHRPHPAGLRQRRGGGRRPVTCRRRRDARPDQHSPGVGAAVQPADRDRGHQADRGRGAAGVAPRGRRSPRRCRRAWTT